MNCVHVASKQTVHVELQVPDLKTKVSWKTAPGLMKIHYQKLSTTCLAIGQRQTTTPHYEISTMWDMKPRMTLKRLLNC
jgi:hypothetical protein